MKLSKYVRTVYLRKQDLQPRKNFLLAMGEVYATTWKPRFLPRPKGWKGEWDGKAGVWVEYKAVGTFTVKPKRKRK